MLLVGRDVLVFSGLINLIIQSPEWGAEKWERLVLYMGVVFVLFLLLILFFVIFSSWWKKVFREKPKQGPAYTLEELRQMRKKYLISEAEYKTLRQKTLKEIEASQRNSESARLNGGKE